MKTEDEQVASSSDASRSTSLIAENSNCETSETIGSQANWRNKPRNRWPWENEEVLLDSGGVLHIEVRRQDEDEGLIVKIDNEDVPKLKFPLRIQNGYAYQRGENSPVAHAILGTTPDPEGKIVIDHINGDHLDNSKANLRITTGRANSRNKGHYSLNHTGIIGLSKGTFTVKNSDTIYHRYVATLTDPRYPINPKTNKGKRYTRAVSYGITRTEEEARAIALKWLKDKKREVGYDIYPVFEGSTTIPGKGVGSSGPKREGSRKRS